ncbi:MAG: hypothetical protein E5W93_19795, partial [Mesorhizobium sp.]
PASSPRIVTGRGALSSSVSPIASVARKAPRSRPAVFSPFTGRRCRQADEGRRLQKLTVVRTKNRPARAGAI